MPHALSELEKSKLLNELALKPGDEKKRINAATSRGKMLDDEHERDIQRARLMQGRWGRPVLAILYIGMALNTLSQVGDRSGVRLWISWAAFIALVLAAGYFIRQWWLMRRLSKRLDTIA